MGPIESIVTQIDLRYVTLRTDDRDLLLPNSVLLTQPLAVIGGTKATPVIITPDEVSLGSGTASPTRWGGGRKIEDGGSKIDRRTAFPFAHARPDDP